MFLYQNNNSIHKSCNSLSCVINMVVLSCWKFLINLMTSFLLSLSNDEVGSSKIITLLFFKNNLNNPQFVVALPRFLYLLYQRFCPSYF